MKLARVNTGLLCAIIAINLYVIVTPFVPRFTFWWQNRGQHGRTAVLQQKIQPSHIVLNIPSDNRLVVPSMSLDQPIIEGPTMASLMKGPWHIPGTSTPDKGSNTVIAGHRFTYTNPRGTFYFLDKVKVGDDFAVYWQHKAYTYKVVSTSQVPPTQISIQNPRATPEVTLFSCTPLWWPKDRLVIVGTLENTYE